MDERPTVDSSSAPDPGPALGSPGPNSKMRMVAVAATAIAAAWPPAAAPALLAFTLAMTALVAVAHRDNFRRMRAGAEPRASRLWLFARRGRGR